MIVPFTHSTQPATMSSREIADLVEKRHDNVKRTIDTLTEQGVIVRPQFEDEQSNDAMGRPRTTQVYHLDKRSSLIVVAQLCPEFTARIVDRWQELESQQAQLPTNLSETLRLVADRVDALAKENEELRRQQRLVYQVEDAHNAARMLNVTARALREGGMGKQQALFRASEMVRNVTGINLLEGYQPPRKTITIQGLFEKACRSKHTAYPSRPDYTRRSHLIMISKLRAQEFSAIVDQALEAGVIEIVSQKPVAYRLVAA